jgi:uncharacterized protein
MFIRVKINLLVLFMILGINGCASNMWPQTGSSRFVGADQEVTRAIIPSPNNISIMLPLKGKGELALTSQAIRNGFLAAYYADKSQSNINVKVVDTFGNDAEILYQQEVANGADVIVGPLTKSEVESIENIGLLTVPTIALNTLDNYQYNVTDNFYQFGLLPQDEVVQAAEKMAREHFSNVAVIVPEGLWGDKISSVFEDAYGVYDASDGQVVATLRYNFGSDLAGQVCNFLANDASKLCVPQKRKVKKHNNSEEGEEEEVMRRQDIDAIFFVATTPAQARQIVPLLKFYYAGDLPIYSISTVYSGTSKLALDQDINDVYFCDMPWVVESPVSFSPNLQAIHKQIITTKFWENSFAKYSKFYALGIDAYNLAVGLNVLLSAPQGGIQGASGTLYLDRFNHIYRKLDWAQMRNGAIKRF